MTHIQTINDTCIQTINDTNIQTINVYMQAINDAYICRLLMTRMQTINNTCIKIINDAYASKLLMMLIQANNDAYADYD